MAPTFLQKLAKATSPTTRDPLPPKPVGRLSISRNRSPSTSIKSTSGSNTASDIPSINIHDDTHVLEHQGSFDTASTLSNSQPNVTIVPPSPLAVTKDIDSDEEDQSLAATPTPTVEMSSSNTGLVPSLLRKQASNKSLKSEKKEKQEFKPPPLPIHQRSATAPPESPSPDPLIESPTELPKSDSPADTILSPARELTASPTKSLGILPPEQTGSALSLNSFAPTQDSSKSSKRPWKRSTTRKPTGLASALAASGLAIANPTLSPSHSAQAAAQISPPLSSSTSSGQRSGKSQTLTLNGSVPGSPPYLSKSPAQSTISHRSKGRTLNADFTPKSPGKSPRQRRTSRATSAKSDAGASENGTTFVNGTGSNATSLNGDDSFTRPDYYSALELDADTSSDDMSGSDLSAGEDEYGDDLIPVTGFAVASTKRNLDFHELFPTVPEGDYLIEDYGCALAREILIQGRLYISENHICFHANIFGWITDLSIPVYEITSLEKKMTAFVIPNAIQITTRQAKYTFTSFLSRDTTFDVMHNIWRLSRPEDTLSLISGSGRGSTEGVPPSGSGENADGRPLAPATVAAAGKVPVAKKATVCACGREGKHYTETAMDIVIPGTPEKINNMLFASGFIKEFMSENQKLLDIQIADWAPVSPGSTLLTQNLTYIKPLAGSLGPKQTKCEIKHEVVFCDFDEYISTVTTTRTPDVPSGGVFAVKTRTCVMWASPVSSKVVITSQVEWSGRSFIKGIIEKSAIDGQKTYHSDLEKAMRTYIQEHQSEFLPEGVEAAVIPDIDEEPSADLGTSATLDVNEKHPPTPEELKRRERERNARGLQWAYDTFSGAYQVGKRSAQTALELVREAWDQSTASTILWFVIVLLVMSNVWTLMRIGRGKAEVERRVEGRKVEEREKWVRSVVRALWEELAVKEGGGVGSVVLQQEQQQNGTGGGGGGRTTMTMTKSVIHESAVSSVLPTKGVEDLREEIEVLTVALRELEGRVSVVKDSLVDYQTELNALD